MKHKISILKKSPLFAGISERDLEAMVGCLSPRERTYAKEAYILSAGDVSNEIGIVLSGCVDIIKEDFWGNRSILARAGEGELFAEAFCCGRVQKLPVSVVTAGKTEILFLDYRKITAPCTAACGFHSQLIQNMLEILSNKNKMLLDKIEHIIKRTTRNKLLSYLSGQAMKAESETFTIPFNRQELADYLSVDRSAMSNELCKLREEGLLEFNKNKFKLK